MIRASLLLLLALGAVAQAFPYAPTYRFRYLKPGGPRPKPPAKPTHKHTPKPGPRLQDAFLTPVVPLSSWFPPPFLPGNDLKPIPVSLVPPTTYIPTPRGGVLAALLPPPTLTPSRGPFPQPAFFRGPPIVLPRLPRPENVTLLSKLSSGPSVTTTVFRAPGGVTATSVQRVEGTSTSLFTESDTVGGKVTTTRKPVVVFPATVGRIGHLPPNVPPVTYLVYQK
ncbi:hypothetical protein HPB52_022679 [Rhipicephalus sanguineus]|uniref:Uncharacterized protein n=1 Tax=Rhipicephalus sanguineus TaxID=34632 RepID=A0A9D4PZ11_RHISA|nr:hypothetical protein HPB52_022679 [Rhipicephalus sanguineus]